MRNLTITRGAFAVALVVVLVVAVFATNEDAEAAIDITGKWNVLLDGGATDTCSFDFVQSGGSLTATASCLVIGAGPFTGTITKATGAFSIVGTLGGFAVSASGTTGNSTMSGSYTTPVGSGAFSGTFKPPPKLTKPGDTDGDGCPDAHENGLDETQGGLRDWTDPNDYYDVYGPGQSLTLDGVIDLPNDILGVIQHFAPLVTSPNYDMRFDRGPQTGANVWQKGPPDGVIDLPNDILGVIQQFQHNCV